MTVMTTAIRLVVTRERAENLVMKSAIAERGETALLQKINVSQEKAL